MEHIPHSGTGWFILSFVDDTIKFERVEGEQALVIGSLRPLPL